MLERLVLVARGENDELRVEPFERRLELVLVLDADDELDAGAELELVGGPTTLASAAESPDVRIGSALAARIASRLPSARSASAPSASARCAASGPSTATISEMPSPSDMAWLRRLGPVTRRNGTSVDRIGYRGTVLLRLAIAGPGGGAAGRRGRRRAGRRCSAPQRADFLAGTESSDRIVAEAATTGSPRSTTAASTGSRAAPDGTSSSPTRATGSRATARSSAAASIATGTPIPRASTSRRSSRTRRRSARRRSPSSRSDATAPAAPRASASRPRRTAAAPGARARCPG